MSEPSPSTPTPLPLLGAGALRARAAELQVRPTKSWGQNFVVDANTVRRIVATAGVQPDDVVLEVGPGLGSLTLALLDAAASVTAVEIDPVLAAALPQTIAQLRPDDVDRLRVVPTDAMSVSAETLPGPAPTLLVANLPYNVSVPVLLTALERLPSLRGGLVMVQAEVGERLAASPGSRIYGAPSAKAAWYADVRRASSVPRVVFWPVPHVDSVLISFARHDPPAAADRGATFAVIDAAFAQRRKTLRAALAGWAGSAVRAEQVLVAAGIDPSARGESLQVADFARIAQAAAGQDDPAGSGA